jgi:glycosyltransferase involved in cell wall biosynthesis
MRVLHLPTNVGSRNSHTVRALQAQGVDAVGLVRKRHAVQSPEGLNVVDFIPRRYPIQWTLTTLQWIYYLVKFARWADIIHWYSGAFSLPRGIDFTIVKYFKKPGVTEWQGAEIRIPEVEFKDNPYYAAVFDHGYEYRKMESLARSRWQQERFRQAGFVCLAPVGMLQYIQRDIFPNVHILPRRLVLSDYQPILPDPLNTKPIVIHTPTAPIAKGTAAVLKAVESLKAKCNFEFHLIQGMPRSQAMQLMKKADIHLDQFVLGDFGSASLEAMALGKPVVCYLKPSVANLYPSDLPIVKATQEELEDVLMHLIKDVKLRHELGQRGRMYVEKYHNATKVVCQLKSIYEELLEKHY